MNIRWRVAQAIEWRWWANYLRKKPPAEYLRKKQVYWNRVVEAAGITIKGTDRILDAGCGPAGIFIILNQEQVDATDPLLSKYEQKLPHFDRTHYPDINFYELPIEQLSFENKYDWVFCLNVINHVAVLDKAIRVLQSALKPGGRLLLSVDVHNYAILKYIFRKIPGDILHPHQHSLEDYSELLTNSGIKIENTIRMKKGNIFDYYLITGIRITG